MLQISRSARFLAPLALGTTLLCGCAIGPDYKRPDAASADHYKAATTNAAAVPDQWWTLFGDSVLNDLEDQVKVNNQNIAQAAAAYAQARAVVRQDRSSLLPSIGVSGGATRTGGGSTVIGGSTFNTPTTTNYQLAGTASWELDIWGKLRRSLENAKASAQASAAELASATLSAQSQLAIAYLELRGADAQRRLLADTTVAYARTLTITQNRYAAGTAARTDVLQAQTTLYSAQNQEQSELLQRAQLENAIAALVGKPAPGFAIAPVDSWTPAMPDIPSGLPSELLQRRPDIASAERSLQAANATIGVNEAAYFPSVSLSGQYGFASQVLRTLFDSQNASHSIGASLSGTVLDFGGRRAQVDQARDAYASAVASYRQTVLTAFQDVENDLVSADIYHKELDILRQDSSAADLAEQLTLNQYKAGTADMTTVVTAEASALTARIQLAQMQVNRQTNAVTLITDLGGGWKAPDYTHYD